MFIDYKYDVNGISIYLFLGDSKEEINQSLNFGSNIQLFLM